MGWFSKSDDSARSEELGRDQRAADDRHGPFSSAHHTRAGGRARDEDAFVKGYVKEGKDPSPDWMR